MPCDKSCSPSNIVAFKRAKKSNKFLLLDLSAVRRNQTLECEMTEQCAKIKPLSVE